MVRTDRHDPAPHEWGAADFISGHSALDFLNTVADTGKTRDGDKIPDWAAVRGWAAQSGVLPQAELKRFLKDTSFDGPAELLALHRFRESAYAVMLSLTQTEAKTAGAALDRLRAPISGAIARGMFELHDQRFGWRPDAATAQRWSDAAALAVEELLRGDELPRVRQCARCTWFFIDRGRGSGRRWCNMQTCGNRAKGEAFRER